MRASFVGLTVLVIIGAAAWVWKDGQRAAVEKINEQNKGASHAADIYDRSFVECDESDGVFWDFATGVCRRIARRGGE